MSRCFAEFFRGSVFENKSYTSYKSYFRDTPAVIGGQRFSQISFFVSMKPSGLQGGGVFLSQVHFHLPSSASRATAIWPL